MINELPFKLEAALNIHLLLVDDESDFKEIVLNGCPGWVSSSSLPIVA